MPLHVARRIHGLAVGNRMDLVPDRQQRLQAVSPDKARGAGDQDGAAFESELHGRNSVATAGASGA